MLRLRKVYSPVLAIVLGAIACATPATAVPPPVSNADSINTIVAGTVSGAWTQTAAAAPLLPSATSTPEPPTFTPTTTTTPTPIFTPTPLIPLVSVSVDTNCRNGPGKVYGYEGALLVGETAEVLARDPSGNYWYVRNPDSNGSPFCWVWGEYATISGNVAFLPVYTPPPTPTPTFTPTATFTPSPAPAFDVSYTSMDTCTGWWAEFKLKNTGSVNFRSVEIVLTDKNTAVTISNLTDGFTDLNGCLTSSSKNTLVPGNSLVVSAPAFAYNPSTHTIQAKVTVCSNPGLSGMCVTKKIEFVP